MKSITTAATATAPTTAATTAPAPDTMIRTMKVDFDQSGALSELISRLIVQQRWAYNMAVREALDDPVVTRFGLNNMLTRWRNNKKWLEGGIDIQRAGLAQGREAVRAFNGSNAAKRANKTVWKDMSRKYRENETEKMDKGLRDSGACTNLSQTSWSNKRNRWSHARDLFRKKGERQALCVFEKPVQKNNSRIMLPGVGTVKVHGDMAERDMCSFQLVETTKKITRRTEDHNRTYRLHVQVRIKAPKPAESTVVRGVDMGIVHNATTVDLDTGYTEFHDTPDGCKRTKGDGISKMYAELSRKRGGSGSNRNSPKKPKSRSYKDLQRKIQKKREKIRNRQTNWERYASKKVASGAGTVCIEALNVRGMTSKAKGRGSSAKRGLNRAMAYSRPGMFLSQIKQACGNAGVKVLAVHPAGTSITCHRCGHKDRDSRISQAEFQCTNHKYECHINADVNAAHNVAMWATGRRGLSSVGARFQRGIAPARSVNKAREPSAGGIAGAPEKGNGFVTAVYNSLKTLRQIQ